MLDTEALDMAASIIAEDALHEVATYGVDVREASITCKDDLSSYCLKGIVGLSCELAAEAMGCDPEDLRYLVADKLEAGFVKGIHSNAA